MVSDTVGTKPSVHFTRNSDLGGHISGILIVQKSLKMAFRTEQSVCIIVDGHILGVSVRRGSTVLAKYCMIVMLFCSLSLHISEGCPIYGLWFPGKTFIHK